MSGIYEEYKSLRTEIMQRQDARLYILAFTVAANGTIIGTLLADRSTPPGGVDLYALALISFSLGTLIVAQLLTIQITQQINTIGEYIHVFIERSDSGIQWQTRWREYKESRGARRLSMGTSKPIAIYYGFLTISIYLISFVAKLNLYWYALAVVSVLGFISLLCSFELYFRWTGGWKKKWSDENMPDTKDASE